MIVVGTHHQHHQHHHHRYIQSPVLGWRDESWISPDLFRRRAVIARERVLDNPFFFRFEELWTVEHTMMARTYLKRVVITCWFAAFMWRRAHAFSASMAYSICNEIQRTSRLHRNCESGVQASFLQRRQRQQQLQQPLRASRSGNLAISWNGEMRRVGQFANKNFFLLGMVVSLTLARLFPSLGNTGGVLRPELFIGKFGVSLVFLVSGLSLELSQLTKAASRYKLNGLTQLMTFTAWPFLVGIPMKALFSSPPLAGALPSALVDGLLILTCLPTTVNMCVILTAAASGNTAVALSNAIFSNLGGIFLTPALLFRFFGASIQLPFLEMLARMCTKVLLPVTIGQCLRSTPAKQLYHSNSKFFKRLQEVVLLGILWNAFCTAISNSLGPEIQHGFLLLVVLIIMHSLSLGALFKFFSLPALKFSRDDVIAAMFCSSQKTLAFGLPLINTVFEGNPNVAAYCAPLMMLHPLQLTIGSALVPQLVKYVSQKK